MTTRASLIAVFSACTLAVTLHACSSGGGSPAVRPQPPPATPTPVPTLPPLIGVSTDVLANPGAQHATEVEPDVASWGDTVVAVFQVGRFAGFGASAIGWARSNDGGAHWRSGLLGGLTQPVDPHNPFARASDPVVAYDAAHAVWLANALPVPAISPNPAAIVSRSHDGLHWSDPIAVAPSPNGSDKNWIACDNARASPHFGNCYVEWDDGDEAIKMNTSSDGGRTWSVTKPAAAGAHGLGGQPVVQPDGTVIVPFTDDYSRALATVSRDGGATWSGAIFISPAADHLVATMRAPPLPSAAADGAGTVYVAWADCAFRARCSANDIVISTSANGMTWTAKARVPIDPTTSSVDHFLPGIAADRSTAGAGVHLALTYFFFSNTRCTLATCLLYVGYVSSRDGGRTWSAPLTLAGPMQTSWLADASGRFVGDYLATTFLPSGNARSVFAVATAPNGSTFDEAMFTTGAPLAISESARRFSSTGERPYPNAHSDHPHRKLPPRSKRRKRFVEND